MTRVVVCCGVGGVGKTTVAAGMAVARARAGDRVVVLTIDPARRLADALGIELGNDPVRVTLDAPGTLDALMLDRKATWEAVIRRYSPNRESADRLLANKYARAVSERLTGAHEYLAVEKLHELVDAGRWDVVVVDTPPTQHVLEFFRAPDRLRKILDRSALKAFMEPGHGVLAFAASGATRIFRRMAGEHVLGDISEFFRLIAGLSRGFRQRSQAVSRLLGSEATEYYLVTAADAPERNDILGFLRDLRDRGMRFSGFVVNRVVASTVPAASVLDVPAPAGVDAQVWEVWKDHLTRLASAHEATSRRHAKALDRIATHGAVWPVPEMGDGGRSLDGLVAMSAHLPPLAARRASGA